MSYPHRSRFFSSSFCSSLPAVSGLRCYTCWGDNPGTCDQIWMCPHHYDRCAIAQNMISKHCMRSDMCDNVYSVGVRCCSEDLCNGAKQIGLFVPLLLVPFIALFLF
uniref:UPAR/Ly6 domain-containing protein n=1 Tax=Echeneis naucrates TaxID=173247 RepID=A0A665TKW8_ECHNA